MHSIKRLRLHTFLPITLFLLSSVYAQARWSGKVKDIYYPSAVDKSQQPALVYAPKKVEGTRPLLVALHTWSNDFKQEGSQVKFGDWCIQNEWFMIHPNFRGKNRTPKALGSDLAVGDIVSAVEYMKSKYPVDENRIYLSGVSGGGHMSLLMAGRHPEIWAGVSAWCSITDIHAWWREKKADGPKRYATEIERACGGNPDTDTLVAQQCKIRSPLTYLEAAAGVNLDINHGIEDGRHGTVPFRHSLYAFNNVVPEADEISQEDIDSFYETQKVPPHLQGVEFDPAYGKKQPVFRKISDSCRVTIFKGSHEIIHEAALNWLSLQRKGQPPVWNVTDPKKIK